MPEPYSKRCWFTFPTRSEVEQPIIWQMSRRFPDVMFDIRQASVQNEIGIMAVLLTGSEEGDFVFGKEGADREAAAEGFSDCDSVGFDAVVLEGEELASAANAGLHFVEE